MKKSLPEDNAFPFKYKFKGKDVTDLGMTLRDWFASQAIAAVFENLAKIPASTTSPTLNDVAKKAYLLADEMLKEREK